MRSFLLLLVLMFTVTACTNSTGGDSLVDPVIEDPVDQGDDDDDDGTVDPPTGVSFSNDVITIFRNSCSSAGCHGSNAASGVQLTSHASTMTSNGIQYSGPTVVAGNAAQSPLIDKIEANPDRGQRMPLGRSALTTAQIQTITDWINEGAQNN